MAQVATLLLSQRLDATTGNLSVRIERLEVAAICPASAPIQPREKRRGLIAHKGQRNRNVRLLQRVCDLVNNYFVLESNDVCVINKNSNDFTIEFL